MESITKYSVLLISIFSLLGCSQGQNSSNTNTSASDTSENISSTSSKTGTFSYNLPEKEKGLTLEAFENELNKLNPKDARKVRYHYHSEEKLIGSYPMTMDNGDRMNEGEYKTDIVTEPRTDNSDTSIQIISGTPTTKNQRLLTQYTSAITAKGWLAYHSQRRKFLDSAQEGEGFEERFYTGPLTTWMMSWGNRPANATMDGTYFSFHEYERIHDEQGYCVTFRWKEYYYINGTLITYNNGSKQYNGSYEWNMSCTFEYLD